jgi:hypothetical protein
MQVVEPSLRKFLRGSEQIKKKREYCSAVSCNYGYDQLKVEVTRRIPFLS